MIVIIEEFTAIRTGSVIKNVICERCGTSFAYEMRRAVYGTGISPYCLKTQGAIREAETTAEAGLKHALDRDEDAVPCPHCGWFQERMVRMLLRSSYRYIGIIAWVLLLIGLILAMMAHFILSIVIERPDYPEKPSVMMLAGASVVLWILLLCIRARLRCLKNPNRNWDRFGKVPTARP